MKPAIVVAFAVASFAVAQRPATVSTRDFSSSTVIDDSPGPGAFISLGDLDGDGDLDIVLAKGRHAGSSSRVLINEGDGRFAAKDIGIATDRSYGAPLGDVNGDGHLDIVLSNELGLGRVLLNDGHAGFQHASDWGNAAWPGRRALLADLNNDSRVDVVVPVRDPRGGTPSAVCLNDGHGKFTDCASLPFGPATAIVAADFDRDGDIDLAAPHRDRGQSLVAYNDGRGGFARVVPFGPANIGASPAAAGDLNKDGWPDVVVGDDVRGILIFMNDGRGALGSARQVLLREVVSVNGLTIADVNGDGNLDIVAGYTGAKAPGSILYNDGTGLAYAHARFGDGAGSTYGLAVGDLNGDGYADIAVARSGAMSTVHLSRPGGSTTAVTTSSEMVSPVPLFRATQRDDSMPVVGVWTGVLTQGTTGDIEVLIELADGTVRGSRLLHREGIVFCVASLTLRDQGSDGAFIFADTADAGFCLGGTIRMRHVAPDSVQVDVFFDARAPLTSRPSATALLTRKQ